MRAMQESSACMKFALAESSLHCPSDSECGAAGFHTCTFHAQLELECIVRIQCSLSETSQVAWTRAHHAKNERCAISFIVYDDTSDLRVSTAQDYTIKAGIYTMPSIFLAFLAIWTLH